LDDFKQRLGALGLEGVVALTDGALDVTGGVDDMLDDKDDDVV
jgi:hypothetical protein